ncbi:carboxypeptidase regulatory-like domain-containing protein [Cylindrospermum sp. FACHB-282]|uniref:carboxypeptidase regulatory-like domain-containing protein n=1 Tax=Cylindrospermum sp. FACHB-282 TaxID=2692794 RepID=UPI0016895AA8|nr:carboxypeptidase regulatory-like domain-containing protein [Cylindrospermum sp. FACHB-282]MBD2387971.1 carboxypeptidase regulatory-like domain-containing protein [Cylindrospermum sp. FACHB-282]
MFFQAVIPPQTLTVLPSESISQENPQDTSIRKLARTSSQTIAIPSPPETLPSEFSTDGSLYLASQAEKSENKFSQIKAPDPLPVSTTSEPTKNSAPPIEKNDAAENIVTESKNLLLGVIINEREVGSLDVVQEGNTLLLPLFDFAQIGGFTVETTDDKTRLKTPAGEVSLTAIELRKINGITYISDTLLREKLATNIELKLSDLALIVDLPWRRGRGESRGQTADLQPEVRPPSSGLSNIRQELNVYGSSGNTNLSSSTLLNGRLAGGSWRVRLENNFVNQPDITEYFFFKRSGKFLYQIGRQQIGLHPLLSGMNFTGVQIGSTNLPTNKFKTNYSASELLPRRSQAVQTFRGVVPPTSFVQLRLAGIVVAQQQVGLNGEYQFLDVNVPTGQSNDIELLIFDRNNLSAPREIRSLRLNASDLLLPSGGNVQLAGLGVSGNYINDTLFTDSTSANPGSLLGFYQIRQGLFQNLTFEGAVQMLPDTTQAQAGFVWRLANPAILATSVGTSRGGFGYTADLDIQLDRLQITGNSELYPARYLYSTQSRERFNHSLEAKYKVGENFSLGLIARSRQDDNKSGNYILPTFSLSPFSGLSLSGRPDFEGIYFFTAFYQASLNTRLSFNSFGDTYTTNLSHNLSREYLVSLGTESGGDLATRYTATLNRNAPNLSGLSWRLGLGYRDGEVGAVVGASMRVLPGLFARVEYQGIPSRNRTIYSGFGDDRLSVSLVSDLSFAGGRISPSEYTSIGKDKGAISGRVVVERANQSFDLSESTIRVFNKQGQPVGEARTDAQGNFFVGNLLEDIYLVEFDPERLPVELSLKKTTIVAEVASSAITKLDFPVRVEYGVAGRVTDAAGQPIAEMEVELINAEGKRVSTSVTDQFGLYRLDAVPVGKYILQIPPQDGVTSSDNLPKRDVSIDQDFVYEQNLQLPIAPAVKETKEPALDLK